jgi:hypothetical protein
MVVKHLKTIDFRLIYDTARACHREDGIRGSKDLRAGIRKFLTPTNERKKMSKKTMKQRIALVAVTALTAGVLSVATSPVANAEDGFANGQIVTNAATATGICAVSNSAGALSSTASVASTSLAVPTTVTMAVGGVMPISTYGGNLTGLTITSGGVVTLNTTLVLHGNLGLLSADAGATGSMTVTANAVGTSTLTTYVADPMTALNTPSTAVPTYKMIFSVVATCSAVSTYSTTYSGVNVAGAYDTSPQFTDGDVLSYGAGEGAYINMDIYNSYGAAFPSTTSWSASATNGALVKFGIDATIDDSTTSSGTTSVATATTDGDDVSVRVNPASATAGGTTTVTITAGGSVVATKTITFLPEATTINVVGIVSGPVGGQGAVLYSLTNGTSSVPGSISALSTSLTNRVSALTNIKAASISASDLTPNNETESSTATNWATAIGGSADATSVYGLAEYTCSSGGGSGSTTLTLRHETPVTEVYVTKDVALTCAGGISTYTVSMDKAAYKIGEIGTLTITAKDSSGNAVNDFSVTGTTDITAGGGALTKAATAADGFTGGVKKYSIQMTTAGTFNAAVNIAGVVTKSATAGYSISGGDASNAEVLKSIVALIASINKQIQALQKLILKR